jgi:Tfp pilus assembly protein PilF
MSSVGASRKTGELVQIAESLSRAGRHDEAARAWTQVLTADPENPRALFVLGQQAFQAANMAKARDYLARAARAAPSEPGILVNLAAACRALGDAAGEMTALDRALVIDELLLPAMLMKASALERIGKTRAAVRIYRRALRAAPPLRELPDNMAAALARGRELVEGQADELEAFLKERIAGLRMRNSWLPLDRFDEALAIAAGKKQVFTQQPTQLHYPGLPAIPFYDETVFPWLRHLEAAAPDIRRELEGLITEEMDEFAPYVLKPENVPVQQWGELNHSTKWSAYFLWQDGNRDEAHCARCPVTAEALAHARWQACRATRRRPSSRRSNRMFAFRRTPARPMSGSSCTCR